MTNKRIGEIYQILDNDNIGLIREEKSGEEFIFFLDEISKYETRSIKVGANVAFEKDETFVHEIAKNLITIPKIRKVS